MPGIPPALVRGRRGHRSCAPRGTARTRALSRPSRIRSSPNWYSLARRGAAAQAGSPGTQPPFCCPLRPPASLPTRVTRPGMSPPRSPRPQVTGGPPLGTSAHAPRRPLDRRIGHRRTGGTGVRRAAPIQGQPAAADLASRAPAAPTPLLPASSTPGKCIPRPVRLAGVRMAPEPCPRRPTSEIVYSSSRLTSMSRSSHLATTTGLSRLGGKSPARTSSCSDASRTAGFHHQFLPLRRRGLRLAHAGRWLVQAILRSPRRTHSRCRPGAGQRRSWRRRHRPRDF